MSGAYDTPWRDHTSIAVDLDDQFRATQKCVVMTEMAAQSGNNFRPTPALFTHDIALAYADTAFGLSGQSSLASLPDRQPEPRLVAPPHRKRR